MPQEPLNRILYVDDEADIREIVQLSLEAVGGFTVSLCASGSSALEAARSFRPDLILLDVMMPGMDGPETLRRLRELPETAQTPVVFMTAKVQAGDLERYRELGAAEVVSKPFDPMTLAEQVRRIWRRRGQGLD
ncbi:MAG: response regulator [Chromatiales bacterium]|jgi:CheY-like chemotaxis protein